MTARAAILLLFAAVGAGCQQEAFTSSRLGQVDYANAFAQAKEVFGQYYTVGTADAATGRIVGLPKTVSSETDRLLTRTTAREMATLRLRRDGDDVWADVRVAVQRLDTTGYRNVEALYGQRDVPRQTPAQGEAPLTPQQDEVWRPAGNDLQIEQRILIDLVDRMKGEGKQAPQSETK